MEIWVNMRSTDSRWIRHFSQHCDQPPSPGDILDDGRVLVERVETVDGQVVVDMFRSDSGHFGKAE